MNFERIWCNSRERATDNAIGIDGKFVAGVKNIIVAYLRVAAGAYHTTKQDVGRNQEANISVRSEHTVNNEDESR